MDNSTSLYIPPCGTGITSAHRYLSSDIEHHFNVLRRSFLDAVESGKVEKVVVTYRDRLARFGMDLLERTFRKHGTTFDVVSNQRTDFQGTQQELAEDLLSVCNYFVAKDNGRRAAANVGNRTRRGF